MSLSGMVKIITQALSRSSSSTAGCRRFRVPFHHLQRTRDLSLSLFKLKHFLIDRYIHMVLRNISVNFCKTNHLGILNLTITRKIHICSPPFARLIVYLSSYRVNFADRTPVAKAENDLQRNQKKNTEYTLRMIIKSLLMRHACWHWPASSSSPPCAALAYCLASLPGQKHFLGVSWSPPNAAGSPWTAASPSASPPFGTRRSPWGPIPGWTLAVAILSTTRAWIPVFGGSPWRMLAVGDVHQTCP
jgi:hypothetical protein